MFSRLYSAQTNALQGHIITVEVDISKSFLHAFSVVGLPDKAVEEARDRVSSAIKNSGFDNPKSSQQKIVVSLSPASLKKEGSTYDLAIALGYLLSNEVLAFNPEEKIFLGELALNGELRPIHGTLPLVETAKKEGFKEVFVPYDNREEAGLISDIAIFPAKTLQEVIDHLLGKKQIEQQEKTVWSYTKPMTVSDFSDVSGQYDVKRGLEIAASGGHNIAMYGPPGTGKTMLAKAFTGILPELSEKEALEVTSIHSIAGTLRGTVITHPPFRAPHNTASYVSVIGGGTTPKPGEVTLAHRGVLFLDEFPEFDRRVLESLRQPLEDRTVNISRAKGSVTFPTNFILIAAMNPPPHNATAADIVRYERKISGPIMDRIDMWVYVDHVPYEDLGRGGENRETSEAVAKRVRNAREIQHKRFGEETLNSEMSAKDIAKHITLLPEIESLLGETARTLNLSPRSYHRVLKLARTIADLEGSSSIERGHILEALQYRPKKE
jgi:magnesium chelatase family protein